MLRAISSAPHDPDGVVVLATASNGHGHVQAAINLQKQMLARRLGWPVETVNVYDSIDSRQRMIVENLWECASTTVGLRGAYSLVHRVVNSSTALSRLLQLEFAQVTSQLLRSFVGRRIVHFVALHPAAVPIGAQIKRVARCRLSVVATDFVIHNSQYHRSVDRYYVPPFYRRVGGLAKGLGLNPRIESAGIPIGDEYAHLAQSRMKRKEVRRINVLVSFGGSGFRGRHNLGLLAKLIAASEAHARWSIVTGHDSRLYCEAKQMVNQIGMEHRTTVLGFVDDMPQRVAQATVVLGKAGGLSVSEALALGIPTIIIDTLPGQEDYNADAVLSAGAGIRTRSVSRILTMLSELRNPQFRSQLRQAISPHGRPDSSARIVDGLFKNMLGQYPQPVPIPERLAG